MQHEFRVHVVIYVMVNSFLVAIWAMSGSGYFWPIFPIVGWGIGVVANAWDAFGRDEPTERQISREMARMRDGS